MLILFSMITLIKFIWLFLIDVIDANILSNSSIQISSTLVNLTISTSAADVAGTFASSGKLLSTASSTNSISKASSIQTSFITTSGSSGAASSSLSVIIVLTASLKGYYLWH